MLRPSGIIASRSNSAWPLGKGLSTTTTHSPRFEVGASARTCPSSISRTMEPAGARPAITAVRSLATRTISNDGALSAEGAGCCGAGVLFRMFFRAVGSTGEAADDGAASFASVWAVGAFAGAIANFSAGSCRAAVIGTGSSCQDTKASRPPKRTTPAAIIIILRTPSLQTRAMQG